ncbi:ParA family protein, partial [Escherichia coli]|nr:ParA family protein [Escherichia coli]
MKVISLINMKGGVGKSTLATNIANHLSDKLGQKILLIDIDPQFNATQCVMDTSKYVA